MRKTIEIEICDLCEECLEKITVIHSVGVMCNEYEYTGGKR